jgi:large subunit ribosomal protein L21
MFAIIETGGKQYIVEAGNKIKIEKLEIAEGENVTFENVLLTHDGKKTEIGTPFLKDVSVEGKVLRQGRGEKKIVFKYKAKVRRAKKKGHRQPFTEVEIVTIK